MSMNNQGRQGRNRARVVPAIRIPWVTVATAH